MDNNKFKLKHTKFQNFLEVISILLLISMFAALYLNWGNIPDRNPGHYNALGEIDRWGNKSNFYSCPL